MDQQDKADIIAVMEARMAATMEETGKRMRAFDQEARRFDKIEEDVATLAEHIGEIRRALAEIAAGQQAQAQAAATLGGRVDAVEQATTAIREVMAAHDDRVRQVSASMGELRLAARDQAAAILSRPEA